MTSRVEEASFLLLGGAFVVASIIGFVRWSLLRRRISAGLQVTGHLDSCELATFLISGGEHSYRVSGARLKYVFTVDGEYYGGTLRLTGGFSSPEQIREYCAGLKGKPVVVRYAFRDPTQCDVRFNDNPILDFSSVSGSAMRVLNESADCVDFLDLIPEDLRHGT